MISWKPYTDSGDPSFVQTDIEYQIICAPGDRGRWLGEYIEPIKAGQQLTILAKARSASPEEICSSLLLVWWKNEPGYVLHSTEHFGEICGSMPDFQQFLHNFTVPEGVKSLRIDLRAWAGPGTSIFKEISIIPTPEPDPDPDPIPPDHQLSIDLDLNTVTWRITASEESVTALRIPRENP